MACLLYCCDKKSSWQAYFAMDTEYDRDSCILKEFQKDYYEDFRDGYDKKEEKIHKKLEKKTERMIMDKREIEKIGI